MKINNYPDFSWELLDSVFEYRPETGDIVWKIKPCQHRKPGAAAGCKRRDDYRRIKFRGRTIMAHRLAWMLFHKRWPTEYLDHINGDKTDNRIDNLREATFAQNQHNCSLQRNNRSGIKGVHWMTRGNCWRAQIKFHGKLIRLGNFKSREEAAEDVYKRQSL